MAAKTCRTCRWWKQAAYVDEPGWGACVLAGYCTGDEPRHRKHGQLAIAQDFESYQAWLETAPDFGCVQWEAKDGEKR